MLGDELSSAGAGARRADKRMVCRWPSSSETTTKSSGFREPRPMHDIRKAYRKLARKHHPDVNPGDKVRRGEIQGGQRSLPGAVRIAEKRRKYDDTRGQLEGRVRIYSATRMATCVRRPVPRLRRSFRRSGTRMASAISSRACSAARRRPGGTCVSEQGREHRSRDRAHPRRGASRRHARHQLHGQ